MEEEGVRAACRQFLKMYVALVDLRKKEKHHLLLKQGELMQLDFGIERRGAVQLVLLSFEGGKLHGRGGVLKLLQPAERQWCRWQHLPGLDCLYHF